jgi:hypothetical protein
VAGISRKSWDYLWLISRALKVKGEEVYLVTRMGDEQEES